MKGKIDKDGYLWKEVPGKGLCKCICVNSAGCSDYEIHCTDECVAFEGPLPEKECTQVAGDGTTCLGRCEKCELFKPTGRMEIHYCKGVLKFDEFEDERAIKKVEGV